MNGKRHVRPTKPTHLIGYDIEEIPSATEQTGLIPTPPQNDSEAESYEDIYPVHGPKPTQ